MKERPILFSTPMVIAILEGRKTMTRQIFKSWQVPTEDVNCAYPNLRWAAIAQKNSRYGFCAFGATEKECVQQLIAYSCCPYGNRGDKLWVRETFAEVADIIMYKASPGADPEVIKGIHPWKRAIFMPRDCSRITLEIISVRAEKVQDITGRDVLAEGFDSNVHPNADYFEANQRGGFMRLWNSINEKRGVGWNVNPWCWVIEFRRV